MPQVQITKPADFMTMARQAGLLSGPAALAAARMNVNALRPVAGMQINGLLIEDEWKELDQAVLKTAYTRLRGVDDLRRLGLVQPLGGLGSIMSSYARSSDMQDATISMYARTRANQDLPDFDTVNVPVPIIHMDFPMDIRHLEASRRLGDPIDVTAGQIAARKVAEAAEGILFSGSTIIMDGNAIYGYTNHPNRNTGSATGDWGTITNVHSTVINMIAAAEADGHYGPFGLYVASTQYAEARRRYTDGSGQTALGSVLELDQISFVDQSPELAAGSAVLVEMMAETVDLAVAVDITTVQWQNLGGMEQVFKVMAVLVPRVKADKAGNSGVVHYTGL